MLTLRQRSLLLWMITGLGLTVLVSLATPASASNGRIVASRVDIAVGEVVTVSADISPTPRSYRFSWGDGTYQAYSPANVARKSFARPGTYRIEVDVATSGIRERAVASVLVTVGATSSPPPSPTPTPTPTPTPSPPGPVNGSRPPIAYTADSYFRSTVAGATADSTLTAEFQRFMSTHPDQAGTAYPAIRGVGGNKWGTTYAMGKPGDVVWRLAGNVPAQAADLKTTGFYAPANFADELTLTSDSPFVVHDSVRGQTIWGAKATKGAGNVIQVGAAGRYLHASNGLDYRNPLSTNKTQNVRSRGAIPDGMVIRKDLMDYAVANNTGLGHVLHFFIVESSSAAGFTHPMVGEESDKFGFGAEGQRLAIRSDIDLTKRGLSPEGLAIARTLQTHGMYIGDNAGTGSSLKAEQESPSNPVWSGRLQADELRGITWADFVVLASR